ncbi:MAG: FAD:protein FMN transferase [Muricoprocola sp.]
MKRYFYIISLLAVAIVGLCGCIGQSKETLYEKDLLYFDTIISLKFYANDDGDKLMQYCTDLCEEYENIFSRTKTDSELYKINHRTENTVTVSDEIAELVSVGLEYYQISGGKFDITVAPLSDLWNFKSADAHVPAEEDIQECLAKVDASTISLDGNTLTFSSPDTMIDLGALVKGYAADKMKKFLVENGVSSGILNLGGNVLTIGSKPDGNAWNIGIRKPFDEGNAVADVVPVIDKTVVSSGIYERYFIQDDVIYHHILDPDTGYPIQNDIYGVSIICDSSLQGDALSTTCLTLGSEQAYELISSMEDVDAIFILDTGEILKTGDL